MAKTLTIAGNITFYMGNEILRESKYASKKDRSEQIAKFEHMVRVEYASGKRFWYVINPKPVVVAMLDLIPDVKKPFERPKAVYSNKSFTHQ